MDAAWSDVVVQVSMKPGRFFDAFIAQSAMMTELTPCKCAVCVHADQLGLKLVVHSGQAVFRSIAGRPQVSGPDVILAHRLLKNSVARDAVYEMSRAQLNEAAQAYVEASRSNATREAALQQLRNPLRPFGSIDKALMVLEAYVLPVFFRRAAVVDAIVERGKRKEPPRHRIVEVSIEEIR